ncbi:hypothetical protein BKA80DRAFT_302515 [Phyllosticta citrichinensis]
MVQGELGLVSGIRWMRCGVSWPISKRAVRELQLFANGTPRLRNQLLVLAGRPILGPVSSPTLWLASSAGRRELGEVVGGHPDAFGHLSLLALAVHDEVVVDAAKLPAAALPTHVIARVAVVEAKCLPDHRLEAKSLISLAFRGVSFAAPAARGHQGLSSTSKIQKW